MDNIIEKMLSMKTWVVSGSTHDPNKFAYKIYNKLKDKDYIVYSLNPSGKDVEGDISYKSMRDIPVVPDVIDMVINPIKGQEVIADAIKLGVKYVWFQPGAETDELIKIAKESNINVVFNRCVLVELG